MVWVQRLAHAARALNKRAPFLVVLLERLRFRVHSRKFRIHLKSKSISGKRREMINEGKEQYWLGRSVRGHSVVERKEERRDEMRRERA